MKLPSAVTSLLASRNGRVVAGLALIVALAPIADLAEREPADARPYAGRKVTFEVSGAQGRWEDRGGRGAVLQATAELTPGSTVAVTVGGSDGFNGGGSDLRIGGTALSDRVLVAAGGGGAGDLRSQDGGGGGGGSYVDPSTFPSGPSVADSDARSGHGRVRISLDGGATWVATYEYSGTVETYTVPWAPRVDSIDPTTGPTVGGTEVTLTGQHLDDVNSVSFCGIPGTGLAVSDSTVTIETPAGSIGTCDVVLQTNVSGSSSVSEAFRYYAVPLIESASPAAGPLSGGSIDLIGTGFSGTQKVTIGGQKAIFSVNSDTSITATVPPATAGEATIAVTTKDTTGTGPAAVTYMEAPMITGVTPSIGSVDGGTSVTISGTHFGPATAVDFGTAPAASYTVDSVTQITAIAPGLDAAPSDVSVTTPGGTAVDTDGFRAYARPAVTAMSSPIGPSAGGGTLVVTGTNLADVDAVEFGGTPADSFTVDSDTQLTVVTPTRDPGAADLVVRNPVFASEPVAFTFIEPLTVAIVDGGAEVEPGSDLEIGGGGFAPNTEIDIELRSTPRHLGTATTDDSGRFTATVTIPSETDPGPHRVVATGIDPFGTAQSVSMNVEVRTLRQSAVRAVPASSTAEAAPTSLAATGRGFGVAIRTGLILLILGTMMLAAGRGDAAATSRGH